MDDSEKSSVPQQHHSMMGSNDHSGRSANSDVLLEAGQDTAQVSASSNRAGPFIKKNPFEDDDDDDDDGDDGLDEEGPLTPQDIEEWHSANTGSISANNSLNSFEEQGSGGNTNTNNSNNHNNSESRDSFDPTSVPKGNSNNNNTRDKQLASSAFTTVTTSSMDTDPVTNPQKKKGYYNLSRSAERDKFMEVMNGNGGSAGDNGGGGGNGGNKNPFLDDEDDNGPPFEIDNSNDEELLQTATYKPRSNNNEQYGITNSNKSIDIELDISDTHSSNGNGQPPPPEEYASMQELLDEKQSRRFSFERFQRPNTNKRRKLLVAGACVLVLCAVAGVMVWVLTTAKGGDGSVESSNLGAVPGGNGDGGGAPSPNGAPSRDPDEDDGVKFNFTLKFPSESPTKLPSVSPIVDSLDTPTTVNGDPDGVSGSPTVTSTPSLYTIGNTDSNTASSSSSPNPSFMTPSVSPTNEITTMDQGSIASPTFYPSGGIQEPLTAPTATSGEPSISSSVMPTVMAGGGGGTSSSSPTISTSPSLDSIVTSLPTTLDETVSSGPTPITSSSVPTMSMSSINIPTMTLAPTSSMSPSTVGGNISSSSSVVPTMTNGPSSSSLAETNATTPSVGLTTTASPTSTSMPSMLPSSSVSPSNSTDATNSNSTSNGTSFNETITNNETMIIDNGTNETDTSDDPQANNTTARLSGTCPVRAEDVIATTDTKNVVVPYEYTIITNSRANIERIVQEMENAMHRLLLSDKCSRSRDNSVRIRTLQDATVFDYRGFNSNPADRVSDEGCDEPVSVGANDERRECHLISGGVTVVVPVDANDEAVTTEVEAYEESVLLDPANYERLGVSEVRVVDSTTTSLSTSSPTATVMPSMAPSSSVRPSSSVGPTSLIIGDDATDNSTTALDNNNTVYANDTSIETVGNTTTNDTNETVYYDEGSNIPTSSPASIGPTTSASPSSFSPPVPSSSIMPTASPKPTFVVSTFNETMTNETATSLMPSASPASNNFSDNAPSVSNGSNDTTSGSSSFMPTYSPSSQSSSNETTEVNNDTATSLMPSASPASNNFSDNAPSVSNGSNDTMPTYSPSSESSPFDSSEGSANTTNTTVFSEASLLERLDALSAPYVLSLSMESEASLSRYGSSVAISTPRSGSIVVAVGAKDATNEAGEATGAVYLYTLDNDSLTSRQVLYGQVANDEFGNAIAISQDGNRIVVGSRSENGQMGGMRIYQQPEFSIGGTMTWLLMEGGVVSGESASVRAGWAVSISADGNLVAMGSPKGGSEGGGSILTYRYNDGSSDGTAGSWDQYGSILEGLPSGEAAGYSISLHGTGFTMVVGFPKALGNAGKTVVYVMAGSNWELLGQEVTGEAEGDVDGTSVAMSQDGSIVVIGGKGRDEFDPITGEVILNSVGYCRVYKFGNREWEFQHSIVGKFSDERLGSAVAVSPDGRVVACGGVSGSVNGDSSTSGVVRLWNSVNLKESVIWPRGGDAAAVEEATFGPSLAISDGGEYAAAVEGATFGASLAISDGGEYVVVGAPTWSSSTNGGTFAGAI
eukprot:CAMPEP_0172330912 /NCGR_PEP_ID=MMETSP1058-20130122/61649_1 /TAXON_ID=83371 /ORGANISM="Detonula confervacea, Strain CCMP 353" /LENGTH=1542 /DNA_ID=CAMNT_0013048149 /DNA_START=153 /DNA_END=4778 /DNA_ORIENTATION=+